MKENIVNFSGGKDSTAMLLYMIDKGIKIDEVIYVDTTKEFSEMYQHIDLVAEKISITKLSIDFDYWFKDHIKTKGKNKGLKGYAWPDFKNRWCTRLKLNAINKYLKGRDCYHYIGIASDEQHRVKDTYSYKYPLIEAGMTEKDCLEYCYEKGYTWGGLYTKFHRVSCYCCPLKRINELRILYTSFPALWQKMRNLDKYSYRKFNSRYTLKELEERFEREKKS